MHVMKCLKRGGIMLMGGALLLAAAAPGAMAKSKVENPHNKKSDPKACLVCHTTAPGQVRAGVRRDAKLKFGGDIVAMCSSCHEAYSHMHPVKIAVAPDMKSPDELPLDKDGKITCITCHDVMEGHGINRKKRFIGKALCLNCHFDSDILAQIVWYPTHLKRGEQGRLEIKAAEFRIKGRKSTLGDSVLLYYTFRNVDTKAITFGTNILYDDGSHGDRTAHDGTYTLMEEATNDKKERRVYTGWLVDGTGRRSNTVTLAVEYE
jgi:hypothetical protein